MNKAEALKVKIGDVLTLVDWKETPGRDNGFPFVGKQEVEINRIAIDSGGNPHFAHGVQLVHSEDPPLKSRETGEEIDGSRTYWLHPSRFEFPKLEAR